MDHLLQNFFLKMKVMLDLFRKDAHPYNLRSSLINGSHKTKTSRKGAEIITFFDPKLSQTK